MSERMEDVNLEVDQMEDVTTLEVDQIEPRLVLVSAVFRNGLKRRHPPAASISQVHERQREWFPQAKVVNVTHGPSKE